MRGTGASFVARPGDLPDYLEMRGDAAATRPFVANLVVNARGRVEVCTIAESTGIPAIDERMCTLAKRRANFIAATDALGKHIAAPFILRVPAIRFQ
jgi:hypothetical protein